STSGENSMAPWDFGLSAHRAGAVQTPKVRSTPKAAIGQRGHRKWFMAIPPWGQTKREVINVRAPAMGMAPQGCQEHATQQSLLREGTRRNEKRRPVWGLWHSFPCAGPRRRSPCDKIKFAIPQ